MPCPNAQPPLCPELPWQHRCGRTNVLSFTAAVIKTQPHGNNMQMKEQFVAFVCLLPPDILSHFFSVALQPFLLLPLYSTVACCFSTVPEEGHE